MQVFFLFTNAALWACDEFNGLGLGLANPRTRPRSGHVRSRRGSGRGHGRSGYHWSLDGLNRSDSNWARSKCSNYGSVSH